MAIKASGLLANIRRSGRRTPKTIAVIGAGRFGTAATQELLQNGHEVLLIDCDSDSLQPLANRCTTAVGNAENPDFLAEAGIKEVDAVIVAIGENESASNHSVINCKDMDLYVMAKAKDLTHGKILERLGADYVMYPERDSGVRLARLITRSSIVDMVELYDKVFMMEIASGPEMIGRTLQDLDLPNRSGVQIVAILRDGVTLFPVLWTNVIQDSDRLVMLGTAEDLQKVAKLAERVPK